MVRPHRVAAVPPLGGAASPMKGNTIQNGRWERGEKAAPPKTKRRRRHHPMMCESCTSPKKDTTQKNGEATLPKSTWEGRRHPKKEVAKQHQPQGKAKYLMFQNVVNCSQVDSSVRSIGVVLGISFRFLLVFLFFVS